ncbi:MAG TPA: VIT1/CCC1 transporter family protein [Chloroflexota bacterium]|nr:VIT1/CCC1 transporter family protein [Chloroflexota bacterium]
MPSGTLSLRLGAMMDRSQQTSEQHAHPSELIGEVVLGLNDGIVTTLVFALSVAGASAGAYRAVVVAGLAEMMAGGVSMFLGGYTAARAVAEAYEFQVSVERHEIEQEPEEERAEIRRMYRDRGFGGPLLDAIVRHITADNERWLQVMVRDELGAPPHEGPSPWHSGLAVGLAFMVGALVPILPFLAHLGLARILAAIVSVAALALTGAFRSRYSRKSPWRSAGEMIAVGALGAAAGVLIGEALARIP